MAGKRILVMTVGTGVGASKDENMRSLAHGLKTCIDSRRPDEVYFVGSDQSKETVEHVKEIKPDLPQNQFQLLSDINDFDSCFRVFRDIIEQNPESEIIIDYTSGTKTMTISAAIASVLYHKKLSLISGKRGDRGVVIQGTESIIDQNLFSCYDELLCQKIKESFNQYKFTSGKELLEQIIDIEPEKKAYYKYILEAYFRWDRFDHLGALEVLNKVTKEMDPQGILNKNKEFLNRLKNLGSNIYLLCDLLNNAKRRLGEKKFDDAVARCYRAIEFFGQILLKEKFGLDNSDLDVNKIKQKDTSDSCGEFLQQLRTNPESKGKIKIGLKKVFDLLSCLGHQNARELNMDKKLGDLLSRRNSSILAHGLKPIEEKDARILLDLTIKYIQKESYEFDDLLRKSEFPTLVSRRKSS